jgi:hypothetical protein
MAKLLDSQISELRKNGGDEKYGDYYNIVSMEITDPTALHDKVKADTTLNTAIQASILQLAIAVKQENGGNTPSQKQNPTVNS